MMTMNIFTGTQGNVERAKATLEKALPLFKKLYNEIDSDFIDIQRALDNGTTVEELREEYLQASKKFQNVSSRMLNFYEVFLPPFMITYHPNRKLGSYTIVSEAYHYIDDIDTIVRAKRNELADIFLSW